MTAKATDREEDGGDGHQTDGRRTRHAQAAKRLLSKTSRLVAKCTV